MRQRLLAGIVGLAVLGCACWSLSAAEPVATGLFARKNLVAWCIVPFDSKKRGPEERAAMLEKLGFTRFAYDYRAEHIPTFDAEIDALKRHHIELTAWWFPASLNDEAKMTLEVFAKHKVTPQLWVTGGGGPTKDEADQRARIVAEAARIRLIAEAAAKVGCKVALYNHGGWFGEPENQLAIIDELKLDNVGIVYNLHHGHDHLGRFAELLQKMKPHLYTLNLNGMVKDGDRKGQKILQLGEGDLDLSLLKIIRDSGYTGLIGILGHTQDDAEERLHDNLDGLDWLIPQVNGKEAGPKPKMRTPVPKPATAAAAPPLSDKPLVEGKFGLALNGKAGGAFVAGKEEFRQFPITVECWTRLSDKSSYNILVAHELKSSGTHWEMFSMAGSGNFTAYLPGFAPDHCSSSAMICDGQWHHVAMLLEPDRVRLMIDGKQVADQPHKRSGKPSEAGGLAIGSLVDRAIGCSGVVDEVRISKGLRPIAAAPDKPFVADDSTIGLWHFDSLIEQKRFDDASRLKNAASLSDTGAGRADAAKGVAKTGKIEGHWGEDAIGFRWTEADSRDDRLGKVDSGRFFSGSIAGPGGPVYKGIVVRVGANREASLCYDTELLRAAVGWTGFLKFDPARFGVIVPPKVEGATTFATQRFPGVSFDERFQNFREANPYGPVPKEFAHYQGLYRHGERVVLQYTAGHPSAPTGETTILESPWLEAAGNANDGQTTAITRTFRVTASSKPLRLMVADAAAKVRLHPRSESATLTDEPGIGRVLVIAPHAKPVTIKLFVASPETNEAALEQLVATSPLPEELLTLTQPGSKAWGEPLITKGEVSADKASAYVVDTITLPFQNRFNALFFCGGHDFLPDGRAAVCTLHGDVWLVDGIDDKLEQITWRRFATGLFQPLGLKVVKGQVYVVGRDQITRLHDLNNDGEADFYQNFNNDAHVTLNGHEYVTCLETDRAGNFYYVKGNCNSQTPHDGSLLRVTPDGAKLDVFATGFRNSNGIGMGPNDEITVAPQEGEWTPASGVFMVREGGFYGGMMSHHRPTPPADFERPVVWFSRLADNSSGGQVWTTSDRWGPLSNQLLHMSYGQCRLRLVLRDLATTEAERMNGGSIELPLRFNSGIHRGRMNARDGQLYVTGLKGWTTSAVHDGCFQRVRHTGQPLDMPVGMKGYKNGIALTFSRDLDRDSAQEASNYQLEAWNYKWSAAYGSPEFKPSATGQIGRDEVEIRSSTLLDDNRTVLLELADLQPVDQLAINYTLFSREGLSLEQSAVLTLNSISSESFPTNKLHRKTEDPERTKLLASLVPGIIVHNHRERRVLPQRMAAWTFNSDPATATEKGDEAGKVTATGWIKIPTTGRYRFSAAATPEQYSINLGDAKPASDGYFSLVRGTHPITIEQRVPKQGPVQFRLMWQSNRFPREAVPATMLLRAPQPAPHSDASTGAILFETLRCANCHQSATVEAKSALVASNQAFFDILRAGPRLEGIGSRLRAEWLARWIREPHQLRGDTTMPAVLSPDDTATLNDLVAYLEALSEPGSNPPAQANHPGDAEELVRVGADLYERLGCIACHRLSAPGQDDDWKRVSLHFVNAKYRPQALIDYLKTPHEHAPNSRMPDFRLTEQESVALAAFLNREAQGRLAPLEHAGRGDVARGKVAFTKSGCNNCHVTAKTDSLAKPTLPAIRWKQADAPFGCIAVESDKTRTSPRYELDDAQRSALVQFGSQPTEQVRPNSSEVAVEMWLNHLRCTSCHSRDSRQSLWPEIVAEEGSGKPTESVPQLTWVGEKLQGPWIEQLLKGDVKQKSRPWIAARMPAFPAHANLIAHGLAIEHGVPYHEPLPSQSSSERIELGRRLTHRDGGLDCRQCHGIGKEQPRGDASTQIALGINFALTRNRLRPEFALRQMLDPPRYDIGSRMPRFAPDLKTTAATTIENGDAERQFELLKEFIWSLNDE